MDNDDRQVGRILTRREVLRLLGAAGAPLLVGCRPEESGPTPAAGEATQAVSGGAAGTPTLNAEAQTVVAMEGAPTAKAALTAEVSTAAGIRAVLSTSTSR